MKLRNKKTGETKEVIVGGYPVSGKTKMWECSEVDANEETGYKSLGTYTSLAELNAEWEDAPEEPKTFWYMTAWGDVKEYSQDQFAIKQKIAIGNYFETKEEADKAVEKLKAWKRLKDKVQFKGWQDIANPEVIWVGIDADHLTEQDQADLDLLFGGEE